MSQASGLHEHVLQSSLTAHAGSQASLVLNLEDDDSDSVADHEQMQGPQELLADAAWALMLQQHQQQEVQLALAFVPVDASFLMLLASSHDA